MFFNWYQSRYKHAIKCSFCNKPIMQGESFFRSEDIEVSHTACIQRKLLDLKKLGVAESVIYTLRKKYPIYS